MMVDAAIIEALMKVKTDYKYVNIAQWKYVYAEGLQEHANRDLSVVVLNVPVFWCWTIL